MSVIVFDGDDTLWHNEHCYSQAYAEHEDEIRRIGDTPFDVSRHHFVYGAERILTELKGRGHTLCLLTKYDSGVWPEKARFLNTKRFFGDDRVVCIDGRKTSEDFDALALHAGASTYEPCYTVGNSEGDMVPVVASERWYGFYIPRSSSIPLEYDGRPENVSFDPAPYKHERVTTLKNLPEVLLHLLL